MSPFDLETVDAVLNRIRPEYVPDTEQIRYLRGLGQGELVREVRRAQRTLDVADLYLRWARLGVLMEEQYQEALASPTGPEPPQAKAHQEEK